MYTLSVQVGDKFLASVVGACVAGIGIGVLLVNTFGTMEPSSRAFDQSMPIEPTVQAQGPTNVSVPELGEHTVEQVIAPNVVTLDTIGPVRLLGVDSHSGPDGKPADPVLGKAVLQQIAVGKRVLVTCDPATADTSFKDENGAYLVYLMMEDGVLVNTEVLARGVAVADLDQPCAHRDEFIRAERDARWNGRGLWEVAAAKPAPVPIAPSPSGPDARRTPTAPPIAPPPVIGKNDVLVTKDGRFHRSSCKLSKGGVVMSVEDARAKHYLACPVCFASTRMKV